MNYVRLFYVAGRQLHIGLDPKDRIIGIGNVSPRDKDAKPLHLIDISKDEQICSNGVLEVDARGLTTIIRWIMQQLPNATDEAIVAKLDRYVRRGDNYTEMVTAVLRHIRNEPPPHGEAAHWSGVLDDQFAGQLKREPHPDSVMGRLKRLTNDGR